MKNLLSENMLRFGTKNLSETAQRELVLKSIMETINEHGLHGAVRRQLTEQAQPSPNTWIDFEKPAFYDKYKTYKDGEAVTSNGQITSSVPLVIQSGTSMGEAAKILGTMMKLIGDGQAEGDAMINAIKQVSYNNYPAILWKLRNTGINGTKYSLLRDWLSKYIDKPSKSTVGSGTPGSGGKGPIGGLVDLVAGVETGEFFNKHMTTYNPDETII